MQQRWQAPEKALAFYTSASEKATDEIAYVLARSEMLIALGRQEEALRMLQDKVVYFEHSAVIRDAVGQLLVQFARYKEAADMLREASILATNDLTITEHLAFALLLSGQHREAVEPFQKLIRTESYAKRADLYLALGQCLMETGKVRERYHKVQLAEAWPDPGDHLSVFRLKGVPCSIIICHDERYPELVRLPVLAGSRVVFYLSHESPISQEHKLGPYRAQIQARAVAKVQRQDTVLSSRLGDFSNMVTLRKRSEGFPMTPVAPTGTAGAVVKLNKNSA